MAKARLNKGNLNGSWTPNQLAKRQEIVDAAATVMAKTGVVGCTARAVSDLSPFTTSSLHYYFESIDEIVDLAFRKLMDGFHVRVSRAAEAESDPLASLWAACYAYLRYATEWEPDGTARPERAPMLWFEYQAICLRTRQLGTLREISDRGRAFFDGLLDRVGVDEHTAVASSLYSVLLGSAVRDSLFHRDPADLLGEIRRTLNLPASPPQVMSKPRTSARRHSSTAG